MENKQLTTGLSPNFKERYLRLIASGYIERTALQFLQVDWLDFFEICSRDPEFRVQIEEARKSRADHWVDKIADSLDKEFTSEVETDQGLQVVVRPPTKDELNLEKLNFDKLKFLAQADNPERYSTGGKAKLSVEFDISDFKLLSVNEATKVLANDPFADVIEAEVTEVSDGE